MPICRNDGRPVSPVSGRHLRHQCRYAYMMAVPRSTWVEIKWPPSAGRLTASRLLPILYIYISRVLSVLHPQFVLFFNSEFSLQPSNCIYCPKLNNLTTYLVLISVTYLCTYKLTACIYVSSSVMQRILSYLLPKFTFLASFLLTQSACFKHPISMNCIPFHTSLAIDYFSVLSLCCTQFLSTRTKLSVPSSVSSLLITAQWLSSFYASILIPSLTILPPKRLYQKIAYTFLCLLILMFSRHLLYPCV